MCQTPYPAGPTRCFLCLRATPSAPLLALGVLRGYGPAPLAGALTGADYWPLLTQSHNTHNRSAGTPLAFPETPAFISPLDSVHSALLRTGSGIRLMLIRNTPSFLCRGADYCTSHSQQHNNNLQTKSLYTRHKTRRKPIRLTKEIGSEILAYRMMSPMYA